MILALKDIRHSLGRFLLTVAGVAFLVTASVGMLGLYRGIVADALVVIGKIGADLWVVQGGRLGPFAESSAVVSTLERRVAGVAGVASVRRFLQISVQFSHEGRELRAALTALDFPADRGGWLRMHAGRPIGQGHFEAIADRSLGLALGSRIRLGGEEFTIVGLSTGMVDLGGDGLIFVTLNDAMGIARQRSAEETYLARAGGTGKAGGSAGGKAGGSAGSISAVLVVLAPQADALAVREAIAAWGDANVLSRAEQESLLLDQRLWRLRVQVLAFTAVLLAVMALVLTLIIYMLTMEKRHQIAMLKLIGARNPVIVAMIATQAFAIGLAAFGTGLGLARLVFVHFPRRVIMLPADLAAFALAVALICALASLLGVWRALKVRAQEILS